MSPNPAPSVLERLPRGSRLSLVAVLLILKTSLGASAAPIRVGPELSLPDPLDACADLQPRLAALEDGGFLAVWRTYEKIRARRIEPSGALGPQVEVLNQSYVSLDVAPLPDGGAVIVAIPDFPSIIDLLSVTADGELRDQVSFAADNPRSLRIASSDDRFLLSWIEWSFAPPRRLRARLFDLSFGVLGEAVLAEAESFISAASTILPNDRAAVVWTQRDSPPDPHHVWLVTLDALSQPIGSPVDLGEGWGPSLSYSPDGLLIARSSATGLEAQVWDVDTLLPVGPWVRVDDTPAPYHAHQSWITPSNEGWLVAWKWRESSSRDRLRARRLAGDGTPIEAGFALSEITGTLLPHILYSGFASNGNSLVASWNTYTPSVIIPVPCDFGEDVRASIWNLEPAVIAIPATDDLGLVLLTFLLASAAVWTIRR